MKLIIGKALLAAAAVTAFAMLPSCGLFRATADGVMDDGEDAIASYMNSAVSMSDAVQSEAMASSPSSSTLSAVARNNPQDGSIVHAVTAAAASRAFQICSFIKQLLL